MELKVKQKIALIMSNMIVSGEIAKNEKEKLEILNNSFSFLTKKMNWEWKIIDNKQINEELNEFSKDVFNWLKETRNYYRYFWNDVNKKENSKNTKDVIEQKEYIKKIKDKEQKYTFKSIVKCFIFKNNLIDEIKDEDFNIALLSIFINKYEKDRIIKSHKLEKDDIYKILTLQNITSIYLYKFIQEKEYFLPNVFEVNEILYLLNSNKLEENKYDLKFLQKDLYKRVKNYFNKRNKNQLILLENWKGYSNSKNEKIFNIENTKYLLNEKYLLNLFLLFCFQDKNPSFHFMQAINKFKSSIFENKESWKNKINSFNKKQKIDNIKSFNNMMKYYYEKEDKNKFIKHSLKFLNKYWKNNDSKQNLINIFQNINTVENIKKYIYHNDFDKLSKLLNNSDDYKQEFLNELNIIKSKKIIDSIYEYIKKNINNFEFKNTEFKFKIESNNNFEMIRFHLGSKDLNNNINNHENIKWEKLKIGKSNKILLAYFFLIKEFLNEKNKEEKVNNILLQNSILKDIDVPKEKKSYSKEINKNEKEIIENKPIQQSQLFKSLISINDDFKQVMNFYKWYEENEFLLIDKVKTIIKKEWSTLSPEEQNKQKLINLIMHRKIEQKINLDKLKKELEQLIK